MSRKNTIIKGTFLLTLTGLLTKVIGFYYRIFLNNKIGAEGMGIYQLIFPVYIMCFSFCCVGIQTSLSRIVATQQRNPENAARVLYTALSSSCFLAGVMMVMCYFKADFIAANIIKDERCAPLIQVLSYSFIPASIHSCISGYYYGMKKTAVPSISQLGEQIVRVGGVYLIFEIVSVNYIYLDKIEKISLVVWGLFIGEIASAIISITAFLASRFINKNIHKKKEKASIGIKRIFKDLFMQAIPLTLNRLSTNFLQSAEAVIFPLALCRSGASKEEALAVFGIFTGMALPLIMFPSALTNSLSVLLVSDVAESNECNRQKQISKTIEYTIRFTLFLGIFCNGYFLVNGCEIGQFLFGSNTAGEYITLLSFICPFFYLSSTLGSILHGLKKTVEFFLFNISTIILRLLFLWFLIPLFGIKVYILGFLISQIILSVLIICCLYKNVKFNFNIAKWMIPPIKCCIYSYVLIKVLSFALTTADIKQPIMIFCLESAVYCLPFIAQLGRSSKSLKSIS